MENTQHASSEVDSNIVTLDWILWMEGEKEEKIEVENKITSSERTERKRRQYLHYITVGTAQGC